MTDEGSFGFGGDQRSYSFEFFHADKIPNSLTAVQCPNMPCEQVDIQNDPDSSGNITIGGPDLVTNGGIGWVLEPGKVTGWIPLKNLNRIYHIDAADSTLNYKIIRDQRP